MDKEECSNLSELKEKYQVFQEKYDLPSFDEMNKLFEIEDIDSESDFLLRRIRRVVSEKIAGYLRFVEIILNPSNAPIFFFKLVKKLDSSDSEILKEIYDVLGKFEVEVIGLDLDYNEEKEAEFINKIFKIFNEDIRIKFLAIVEKLGNGEGKKKSKESNGSYFG
ncbi:hypothetical protein HOD75_03615 [archaeon]|jgi:hypothetical protein|nr:hypothetical protein [archaeon]MBT4241959.1 hypothetical protein [archaeon]MBT4418506.1 hypothetical protein [archaeon]